MQTTRQSYRFLVVLLTGLVILSSGTVYGFTGDPGLDAPVGRPSMDRDERSSAPVLTVAYTLADPFKTAEREQTASTEQPDAGRATVPSFGAYVKEFVPDVVGGAERIFSKDNVPLALIGAGLTGLALTVDQRVKKYFQDRKPLEHVENTGDKIGNGYPEVGVGFALLGAGELINNKKLADTGVVSLEAYVIDGLATEGLKLTARRKRPNGGNLNSFPSGHASITATMAASISEMYDWDLRIAVPLYLTTAFIGASRIQANEHFLSDVIAGITVGTLAGMGVAKYHKEKDAGNGLQNISISPLFDKDLRGWVITLQFL